MFTNNSTKTSNKNDGLRLSTIDSLANEPEQKGINGYFRKYWVKGAVGVFVLLLTLGVFAKKGWLPRTDPLFGKGTGWFGKEISMNSPSGRNSSALLSSSTPQLSKEYIYAGSRLLAVEDRNASVVPPTDLAFWRPGTGEWFIFNGDAGAGPTITWGQNGDVPVQGDFDGDGKTDFAVFRPSEGRTYIIRSSDNGEYSVELGGANDVPVPADRDGDGKTDVVVWKTTTQDWTAKLSTTNTTKDEGKYGVSTDKPISGDFDGDGKADNAVWRSSEHTFYSKNSSNGQVQSASFGSETDLPVCADYDGDGKTDFALLSGNEWIILNSSTNTTINTAWEEGDIPVPNDYDADGKADIAVWRPVDDYTAIWYIRLSSDESTRVEKFGQAGDIPVPANYRR